MFAVETTKKRKNYNDRYKLKIKKYDSLIHLKKY